MNKFYGIILILISSLLFATYGIWARIIGNDFGIFFQGYSRGLIIILLLTPYLYLKGLIIPIEQSDRKWMGLLLLLAGLTQAPLFYAYNHMDIGSATLLFFVSMLLTMYVVGIFFLGERMTWIKVASFFIALAGMYLVFSFSLVAFSLLAALMAMLNGVASGGEVSFSKKVSGKYSTLYISWLTWLAIVLTNIPLSLWLGETQHLPSLDMVWFWQLLYTAASIIGYWCIIEGLKHVEAGIGGLLGLLEIIFSVAFGVILFSESVTLQIILGAILIISAAALPHLGELRRKISGQ